MKYLILTDIHSNLTALNAVLDSPEAAGCREILSLGDQINYGPQPREVMDRLCKSGAILLMGNHEQRLTRFSSPEFSGENWKFLHWTQAQIADFPLDFPSEYRLPGVLCTHAVPGDINRLVYAEQMPQILDVLPPDISLLLTGHNHREWYRTRGGRTACNPGSLGMAEDHHGGLAHFAVLETHAHAAPTAEIFRIPYDVAKTAAAFRDSGCLRADLILPRLVLETLLYGSDHLLNFIAHAVQVAADRNVPFGDAEAWHAADAAWAWHIPVSTVKYWESAL